MRYAPSLSRRGELVPPAEHRNVGARSPKRRPHRETTRNSEIASRSRRRGRRAVQLDGDFCWSLSFETAFLRALCYEGFLPICCELGGGSGLYVLLPKLHVQRCVQES